ncbi:hypothetical protein ABEB36_000838 [Hypothenemus hampei]|uniref:Uncharacterized protein n=1 Tax=Hypothenemus hampei TaxID=57062 RepID=A0ABD1FCM2_HYPHA
MARRENIKSWTSCRAGPDVFHQDNWFTSIVVIKLHLATGQVSINCQIKREKLSDNSPDVEPGPVSRPLGDGGKRKKGWWSV